MLSKRRHLALQWLMGWMPQQLGSGWEGRRSDGFPTARLGRGGGKAVGEKMFWGGLVLRFGWEVRVLLQLPRLAILNRQRWQPPGTSCHPRRMKCDEDGGSGGSGLGWRGESGGVSAC